MDDAPKRRVKTAPLALGRSRTAHKQLIRHRVKQSQAVGLSQALRRLPQSQRDYVLDRANGVDKVTAYKTHIATKRRDVLASACNLERKPEIATAIERAEVEVIKGSLMSAMQIRAFVLDGLVNTANTETGGSKVKALELLGKTRTVNLFVEATEATVTHDVNNLKQRIIDMVNAVKIREGIDSMPVAGTESLTHVTDTIEDIEAMDSEIPSDLPQADAGCSLDHEAEMPQAIDPCKQIGLNAELETTPTAPTATKLTRSATG